VTVQERQGSISGMLSRRGAGKSVKTGKLGLVRKKPDATALRSSKTRRRLRVVFGRDLLGSRTAEEGTQPFQS